MYDRINCELSDVREGDAKRFDFEDDQDFDFYEVLEEGRGMRRGSRACVDGKAGD